MNLNNLSAKKICRLVSAGMVFSMLVITGIFGGIMQDIRIFIVGGTLTLCAFFWIWLLVLIFGKRLSHFTSNLCRTLDNMIDGNEELQKSNDSETLFARINHRLIRLYEIMQKNRHKVDMERQELQMLISDISHQVKTPVSNLQMVTDTLLTKPVSEEERMDFLQGIRSQTDKLDFLFQALVKTSRLETGAIRLEKKDSSLFHTLAQAMSSIVYAGSMQYVAVDLLSVGASFVYTALMTLTVNARHLFYSISMLDKYKGTGMAKPFLIFGLTDETYSLLCTQELPEGISKKWVYLFISLLNHFYWITGSCLGSVLGGLVPQQYMRGIDFSMTALFVVIFIEQWLTAKNHTVSLIGVAVSVVCLLIFGADRFMIPSMVLIALILLVFRKVLCKRGNENE